MPQPWLSFAPVHQHWVVPKGISLPYHFRSHVSFRMIPEWVRVDNHTDKLWPKFQDKIDADVKYCIAVEYEADALGSPDSTWTGTGKQAIQATASETIGSVNLALWLACPAPLSFAVIVHAENYGTEWVTRQVANYDPLLALEEYGRREFRVEDFEKARTLLQVLDTAQTQGTVRTAARATTRALMENAWPLRFLLLWLASECLFGPEDTRETTFRLSQRVALFLEKDGSNAREMFVRVKASYAWRSKIVHGLRLSKLDTDKSYALLVELEKLVSRSLVAVLENETIAKTFDGGGREEFLDSLAFK